MSTVPDYTIHEDHYRERRERRDVYAGWFTKRDYDDGMREFEDSLARGFAPRTGRLIDLGCGAGNYSLRLARFGYEVTGIDISETAIEWAKENGACEEEVAVEFICGDGIKLNAFEDRTFDFAFDGHFLHCIIGNDRSVLLENVRRILKPLGFLMIRSIVWPVLSSAAREVEVDAASRIGYLNGSPYRYYPEAEELVREVEGAGFNVLDWRYTVTSSDGYGFQHVVLQCVRT